MTTRKPLPTGLHAAKYTVVHTSSSFRDMLESIPAWDAARESLVNLSKVKLPASSGGYVESLTFDTIEAATAGSLTADDLVTKAADACRAREATGLAAQVLDAARAELIHELDAALEDNWPALFKSLQAEHDDVWAALAKIHDPRQLNDAEAAIAGDRVDDFRAWRDLLKRHEAIRNRYATLGRHSGSITDAEAVLTAIQNPETWPLYAAWVDGHRLNHLSSGEVEPITPPWEPHGPVAGPAWVLWALENDDNFKVWLPTPAELVDAEAKMRQHVDQWRSTYDPNQPLTAAGRTSERRRVHGQMHTDY